MKKNDVEKALKYLHVENFKTYAILFSLSCAHALLIHLLHSAVLLPPETLNKRCSVAIQNEGCCYMRMRMCTGEPHLFSRSSAAAT